MNNNWFYFFPCVAIFVCIVASWKIVADLHKKHPYNPSLVQQATAIPTFVAICISVAGTAGLIVIAYLATHP